MMQFYRKFTSMLTALLFSAGALAAGSALDITVEGVRDDQGTVRAAIYNKPDTFPKEAKAMARVSVLAKTGSVLLQFTDLPAGKYAVMLYHDENNDGQMDKRFGMIPMEGYGLSNNVRPIGKPTFDQCSFDIPETKKQTIELKY